MPSSGKFYPQTHIPDVHNFFVIVLNMIRTFSLGCPYRCIRRNLRLIPTLMEGIFPHTT